MGFYRTGDKIVLVCDSEAKHAGMVPLEDYPVNQYTHGHKWSKIVAAVMIGCVVFAFCALFVRLGLLFFGV